MRHPTRVGILGCGRATQAIHLPVLSTMTDSFEITRVMDVQGDLATVVAGRCGARASTDARDIIDDADVKVVVICSPHPLHADQVVACCAAGKRVVLCEKPLAMSRAETDRIRTAVEASNTKVLVGNMHSYDPAIRRAKAAWDVLGEPARLVRSAIYLPDNEVMIAQATDPTPLPGGAPQPARPVGERLHGAVMALAVHNLPLVRAFCPGIATLRQARYVEPYGYVLTLVGDRQAAVLTAMMPGAWPPDWTFSVISANYAIHARFPPSYVLAGSARVEIVREGEVTVIQDRHSGYETIWQHVDEVARGEAEPLFPLETIIDDLGLAADTATTAWTMQ